AASARPAGHPVHSVTPPLPAGLFSGYDEPDASQLETVNDAQPLLVGRVPVHRFYIDDTQGYLLTLAREVGDNALYQYQQVPFQILNGQRPGTVALNDCRHGEPSRQFFSTDPACEGQTKVGVLGYVFITPHSGSIPLVRCYH